MNTQQAQRKAANKRKKASEVAKRARDWAKYQAILDANSRNPINVARLMNQSEAGVRNLYYALGRAGR